MLITLKHRFSEIVCLLLAILMPRLLPNFKFASIFMQDLGTTWILHELQDFICKALQCEAIVNYASR